MQIFSRIFELNENIHKITKWNWIYKKHLYVYVFFIKDT